MLPHFFKLKRNNFLLLFVLGGEVVVVFHPRHWLINECEVLLHFFFSHWREKEEDYFLNEDRTQIVWSTQPCGNQCFLCLASENTLTLCTQVSHPVTLSVYHEYHSHYFITNERLCCRGIHIYMSCPVGVFLCVCLCRLVCLLVFCFRITEQYLCSFTLMNKTFFILFLLINLHVQGSLNALININVHEETRNDITRQKRREGRGI